MKNDIDYFGLKTFYNKIPVEQYITISEPKIDELFNNNVNDSSLYKIMSGATAQTNGNQGLVPALQAGDQVKFLRGDGTWSVPIETGTSYTSMEGANSNSAGAQGLVPAPAPGDQVKFLRGDGTWEVPIDTNTMYNIMVGATSQLQGGPGLVPKPAAGDQIKFLRGDGTWDVPINTNTTYGVMAGAAVGAAGKEGLVPTPAAGHQASYLRGDGLWVDPQNNTSTTAAGYVLDARVGKVLNDSINTVNNTLTNKVSGIKNVIIHDTDTSHRPTIAAYGYANFSVDLTTLGAPDGYSYTGFSVLCDTNKNLIVSMVSTDGNNVTFRLHNPTNTSQTAQGLIGILKFLTK